MCRPLASGQLRLTPWVCLGVTFLKCTDGPAPGGQHTTHAEPGSLWSHALNHGQIDRKHGWSPLRPTALPWGNRRLVSAFQTPGGVGRGARSPLSPCPQASPPSTSHAESPSQALLAHIRLRRLPLLTLHRPDQRTTGKQRSRMGRTPLAHSHTSCHSDSCPTKPRAGWLQGLEKVGASPFRGWKLGDRARLTGSCAPAFRPVMGLPPTRVSRHPNNVGPHSSWPGPMGPTALCLHDRLFLLCQGTFKRDRPPSSGRGARPPACCRPPRSVPSTDNFSPAADA